jgi:hypothetical protein
MLDPKTGYGSETNQKVGSETGCRSEKNHSGSTILLPQQHQQQNM